MMSGDREPEAGVVRRGPQRSGRRAAADSRCCRPAPCAAVCDGLGRRVAGRSDASSPRAWAALLDAPTDQLSGGQKKRVALAALLAASGTRSSSTSRPTTSTSTPSPYLEEWLAAFPGGLLLVTHDRHVLDRVTNKVLEIDRGATLPPRSARTDGRIRIRGVPRGAHRARSAGRDGRADAQEPRAPRARVAAARRAGAHVEAEGAHRHRQRAARARSRGGGTRGRARPVAGQHPIGIEGRRAPRRRLLVARRHATVTTPDRCSS